MTENEVIAKFKRTSVFWESATNTEMVEAVKVAIQALEEIQQYRAIGTIEEFKALKEKSVEKKPITYTHTHRADCPNCKATVRGIDKPFGDYCSKCGIKLDWSEWREQI